MSDADGWAWIYAQQPPRAPKLPEVCFTGFRPAEKAGLMRLAEESGYRVAKTVTKGLAYLCVGPNVGPAKRRKAESQGARLVDEATFRSICSGESEGLR